MDDLSAGTSGLPRAGDATGIDDHMFSGRHAGHVRTLLRAVLEGEAHTAPSLRSAIEARAAGHSRGSEQVPDAIPVELHHYVDTVARHAWKVTDADVTALKQAGLSEDSIFEITVCAALGAATGRLRQAYRALKGAG
jgi:alkylhydroperoxidase family enzyme